MVERIFLAKPRGFCAGVVMAIQAVEQAADKENGKLSVYHSIVHNHTVVERLIDEKNVEFVENIEDIQNQTVVFSAHGVSPAVRQQVKEKNLAFVDATCPLVTKVHTEVKKYAKEGYTILLIGDSAKHQEIIGTSGEAPENTILVGIQGKVGHGLQNPLTLQTNSEKIVVLTQTTLNVDDTRETIETLKRRFPSLVIPKGEDLCYATKNRQDAVKNIAPLVDLFLVVTSTHSSNGMRLLELAKDLCPRAERLENADDLKDISLIGIKNIGITSAASTPDDLVQDVVQYIRNLFPQLIVTEEGEWENIKFRPARKVYPDGKIEKLSEEIK